MTFRSRITPEAERELHKEITYSLKNWGKKHAQEYQKGILAVVENIAENPFAYPECSKIKGCRMAKYKGNYIIYSVNEAEQYIEVMAFPSVHSD